MTNKKNSIPKISEDRLDSNSPLNITVNSIKEKQVHSFLKGKEAVQPLTTRIPKELYTKFRKIAFEENNKMNQIIIQLIRDYVGNK